MIHLGWAAALAALAPARTAELELEWKIELPGVEGRVDHLAYDLVRRRLFVAALGSGSLEVVDLDTKKRLKSIGGLSEPQGVVFLREADLVAVACGGSGELVVYRAGSLDPVADVHVG